jgi:predicted DNA-binding transcriptional regulator AlpA
MAQAYQHFERQYLNLQEAAQYVGASRSSILRWEAAGDFPRRRKLGPNRVGYRVIELKIWLASREPVGKASDLEPISSASHRNRR